MLEVIDQTNQFKVQKKKWIGTVWINRFVRLTILIHLRWLHTVSRKSGKHMFQTQNLVH